jgi:hypothetical protein
LKNVWVADFIVKWGRKMKKDDMRAELLDDIDYFRSKAKYYESIRFFEAAKHANNLASNIELTLTTLPSNEEQEIS